MHDPKSDAALYLMSSLIQRLTKDHPQLVEEMLAGVKSDQNSTPNNLNDKEHIEAIFKESISVLERIKGLSNKNV